MSSHSEIIELSETCSLIIKDSSFRKGARIKELILADIKQVTLNLKKNWNKINKKCHDSTYSIRAVNIKDRGKKTDTKYYVIQRMFVYEFNSKKP